MRMGTDVVEILKSSIIKLGHKTMCIWSLQRSLPTLVFALMLSILCITTWKNLNKVAKSLLSLPASSTSSERSFSLAGQTFADHCSRLAADSVNGLLFLHCLKSK